MWSWQIVAMAVTVEMVDANMERNAMHWFGRFARRIGVRQEQHAPNLATAGLVNLVFVVVVAQIDEPALVRWLESSTATWEPRRRRTCGVEESVECAFAWS